MSESCIEVSYGQLCVFDPRLPDPFNDWADAHVAQGFSWRPGSVSFGTLEGEGAVRVRVVVSTGLDEAGSRAERILAVPFTVAAHGVVEIGSIGGGVEAALGAGDYELIFEHGRGDDGGMWVNLYFRAVAVAEAVGARVIRADEELSPPAVLVMEARPA